MVRYRDILTSSSMLYYIGRYIVPINETNWDVFSALYYDMVYTFLDDDDGPTTFVLYIICLHNNNQNFLLYIDELYLYNRK